VNLRRALTVASKFVIYGEPNGRSGSFEPLKATYNEEDDVWIVICQYVKDSYRRTAKVVIDDDSEEIVGFEVLA
jgi:hypothetical protein